MLTNVQTSPGTQSNEGSGGRLVTADGRTLPLKGVRLEADARGGVASVVLTQKFENPYDEPLRVTYLFPLPGDGAVSGYAFTIGARRVTGEVDRKAQARERFERALSEGRSAGIVEQERSSLFTQELGNIPPRETVTAELRIDQRLRWLDEGAWEWRFPTAAGPRYTGAAGRVPDAVRTELAVADGPLPARATLSLTVRDGGPRPESSVQALISRALPGGAAGWQVELAEEGGARLDRDVVIRWTATAPKVGVSLDVGRPDAARASSRSAYGLLTLVPPAATSAEARPRPRDLILLLDTSGSMGGEPLAQLKKVCAALIDSLGAQDQLELIEFSTTARRWHGKPVHADEKQRSKAKKWLAGLEAGGGTEMVAGVIEALAPLNQEAQRQVILLTDGYIGFETEVVRSISDKLPAGSRLHVVGVGSAVNRSLTGPTARAGRGVEVIIAPGEDPEKATARLMARTAAPLVTDVELSGPALRRIAPGRLPDLYAGSPALAAVELAEGGGELHVRGRTAFGFWEQTLTVAPCAAGQGSPVAATLFARELVEDLELARAAGGEAGALDRQIETLGIEHQIATRLTTWVAISHDVTVDPSAPSRSEIVPQELPHGVSAEGLGLRSTAQPVPASPAMPASFAAPMGMAGAARPMPPPPTGLPRMRKTVMREISRDDEEAADKLEQERPADRKEPAPEKAATEKQKKADAPGRSPRRLRARIRLAANGELVLEITLADGLDWSPAAVATVHFAGGGSSAATIDAARTTRSGGYRAGQVIRLALMHGGGEQPVTEVTIEVGGALLTVEVEPA